MAPRAARPRAPARRSSGSSSRCTTSATRPSSATTRRARSASSRTSLAGHWLWPHSTTICCPTSRRSSTGLPRSRARSSASRRRRSACRRRWRRRAPSGGPSSSVAGCSGRRRASRPASCSPPAGRSSRTRASRGPTRCSCCCSRSRSAARTAGGRIGAPRRHGRARSARPSARSPRDRSRRPSSRRRSGSSCSGSATCGADPALHARRGSPRFVVLGLGWYALAWAGWGHTFVEQHLIGRYVRNLAGGLASGGAYSPKPWYYHVFFYPQHLPGDRLAVVAVRRRRALAALATGRAARSRARASCSAGRSAPVIVFTPAEWKLRYYLLPCSPAAGAAHGPDAACALIESRSFLPARDARARWSRRACFVAAIAGAALVYLEHPIRAFRSRIAHTRRAPERPGRRGGSAALIGMVAGMLAVAIACRAWGGLVVLVAWPRARSGSSIGEPRARCRDERPRFARPFALEAAALFRPDARSRSTAPTVRPVVVYVGRPDPEPRPTARADRPGQGVIAFEQAYRTLASQRAASGRRWRRRRGASATSSARRWCWRRRSILRTRALSRRWNPARPAVDCSRLGG